MKAMIDSMRIPTICLIGAALFCALGCKEDEKAQPSPPTTNSDWPAKQTTDGGSYEVAVHPDGGEIVRNKHFGLDVTVKPTAGEIAEITVAVDADMPAHRHGMNTRPEISEISVGSYRVEGMLFHMGGDWVISVDVTSGDKTEHAAFPVSVE
jgi:hypothetical protein